MERETRIAELEAALVAAQEAALAEQEAALVAGRKAAPGKAVN